MPMLIEAQALKPGDFIMEDDDLFEVTRVFAIMGVDETVKIEVRAFAVDHPVYYDPTEGIEIL